MKKVSLWQLFGVFAKVGAFTIGGGYAMIPLIEREMVARGWIRENEFEDIIVLAQSAPGIFAVNTAIYAGHRLRGLKGSVLAALGAILPSFVIILAIAMLFSQISDNPVFQRIFSGVRPAAVGLILATGVRLAIRKCLHWWQWVLLAASVLLVAFARISPIWIILTTLVVSVSYFAVREGRRG